MLKNILSIIILFSSFISQASYKYKEIKFKDHKIYSFVFDRLQVKLAKALDGKLGREDLLSIAQRNNAIAAINAGFFEAGGKNNGLPSGIYIDKTKGDEFVSNDEFTLLYFYNNKIGIDKSAIKPYINFEGKSIDISSINKPQTSKGIVVYTPRYWDSTLTNPGIFEVVIENNHVVKINPNGNSAIPNNGFVLSPKDKASLFFLKSNFHLGQKVSYGIAFENQDLYKAQYIVSASNILIKNKQAIGEFPQFSSKFKDDPHARTGVCKMSNGQVGLFVVDHDKGIYQKTVGEVTLNNKDILKMQVQDLVESYKKTHPASSNGMSLSDFANFLLTQKCVDAVNLDGGSSSTFVYKNKIVNSPSGLTDFKIDDKLVREISNAIIVSSK